MSSRSRWNASGSGSRADLRRDAGRARGLAFARDPRRPGWSANRHDQSRRPGRGVPARRPDRRRRGAGLLRARHPVHLGLRLFDQRRPADAPQLVGRGVLLVALRVHESGPDRRGRRDPAPDRLAAPRPHRVRWRARGLRRHQLLAPPDPDHARDLDHVGLRRLVRRQGAPPRAAWRDQHAVVERTPLVADDLSQPDVPARPPDPGRQGRLAAAVRQRPAHLRGDHRAQGRLAHLPALDPADAVRPPPADARLQRPDDPARGHRPATPRRGHRCAQRNRGAHVAAFRARHGGAQARGPAVRARRVHPCRRRPVVRHAVRSRRPGRVHAGDLRVPRVRRRRAAPPVKPAGDRRRPRARHGAGQDPARDPPRGGRPARDPAVHARTTGRTMRRACS